MPDRLTGDSRVPDGDRARLVEELQLATRSSSQAIRTVVTRAHAVDVRPANSIECDQLIASGQTREVHASRAVVELPRPTVAGSFYQLHFSSSDLGIDSVVTRCDQVTMLGEQRFLARFQFLNSVVLAGAPEPPGSDSAD